MALIEKGKCKIEYVNHKALGIGHTSLGQVKLPYTLEGEIVEFERHKYRHQTDFILKQIVTPAIERIAPVCQYYGACGGCLLQHFSSEAYNNFKLNLIQQPLLNFNIATKINPLIIVPPGNRRRTSMQAIKKQDNIFLGYYRLHSHNIINIDHCPALLPKISLLISPLKELLKQILTDRQKLQIFLTEASNGIALTMQLNYEFSEPKIAEAKLINFATENQIIYLALKNEDQVQIIYQTKKPFIYFAGLPVEIDNLSFLQSSFSADQILAEQIIDFFRNSAILDGMQKNLGMQRRNLFNINEDSSTKLTTQSAKIASCEKSLMKFLPLEKASLVDLFCGRGTFTLPLSEIFEVDGYEIDQAALEALASALSVNPKLLVKLHQRNLFLSPLTTAELNQYDYCTINPPRQGASAQGEQLAKSQIKKIVYISCNPESFVRDSLILIQGGYNLTEVTPIDQFYWNPHLEVVGCFVR